MLYLEEELFRIKHTLDQLLRYFLRLDQDVSPPQNKLEKEHDKSVATTFFQHADVLETLCRDFLFQELILHLYDMTNTDDLLEKDLHTWWRHHEIYQKYDMYVASSAGGIIFCTDIVFRPEMRQWNIGSRPEILLALFLDTFPILPFSISSLTKEVNTNTSWSSQLGHRKIGTSYRTKHLDIDNKDRHWYHFVCKRVEWETKYFYITLREKNRDH